MIELGIVLVIGGILGWKYREYTAFKYVKRQQEEAQRLADMAGAVADLWIPIEVTTEGDQLFVHNSDTKEFLAQGENYTEVAKRLVERFPGKRFTMSERDKKVFEIHYGDKK